MLATNAELEMVALHRSRLMAPKVVETQDCPRGKEEAGRTNRRGLASLHPPYHTHSVS